jgi:hypothetical protein
MTASFFRAVNGKCHSMSLDQYFSLLNILLCHKFVNNPLEISSQARIADLNAFKRCLTLGKIRAIHQQQTLISQVKVGTYINSHQIHNIKVDYRSEPGYFLYKFILFLFIVFLILVIRYLL